MKKFLCILLACFMLVSVPVHGYAVSVPTTFGIGVEVILPFLLSLLGVQSKNNITTYQELEEYHDEVYNELVDGLAGMAGTNVIQNFLIRAASGVIDTDSIVWQKLKEIAASNYSSSDVSSGTVSSNNPFNLPSFNFNSLSSFTTSLGSSGYEYSGFEYIVGSGSVFLFVSSSSDTLYRYAFWNGGGNYYNQSMASYTYQGKTVRYSYTNLPNYSYSPDIVMNQNLDIMNHTGTLAWLVMYGESVINEAGFASVSNAFSDVLTSSQKDDIVDGTSVIQLYNPSALQNGLEIIPGGDPDEDPNLRKIPFAITADWWNLLEQFGDDAVNQSVAAYNALNNVDDGTSTGRISRAWESLGLGSVVGSAQNAEEGIIDLTEENIYPRSSTVQQTVTDTIPSSLIPEAPDSGIDNESEQGLYKLPDLREFFPFCIPFDLIDLLSKFVAEPETPQFAIALSTGFSTSTEEVDLHVVDSVASIVRTFELIGFVLALILITRNLIRG